MTTLLEIIIGFITILITNGAFFYSINRKMKKAEVLEKEIDIIRKQDDEWLELYNITREKIEKLESRIEVLQDKIEKLTKLNGMLELKNQLLTWYRCQVNNCPKRIPPHVFDKEGNELELNLPNS